MAGKDKTFVLTRMILLKETLEDQMIMWKQKRYRSNIAELSAWQEVVLGIWNVKSSELGRKVGEKSQDKVYTG